MNEISSGIAPVMIDSSEQATNKMSAPACANSLAAHSNV